MTKLLVLITSLLISAAALSADMPTVHPDSIVARYGKPDRYVKADLEKPPPYISTRIIEYKKERVKFAFVADAPPGARPPFSSWKMIGFIDPVTEQGLTAQEVESRLSKRRAATGR